MGIKMEVAGGRVMIYSPYNRAFVARARKLGGSWDSTGKAWKFDERDVERVKSLVADVYGHYFDSDVEIVDVRITSADGIEIYRKPIYCGPREVARAWGRDSGAKLGDGVVQLEGRIMSGGSVKNWQTRCSAGSVFEVRDFPKAQVEKIDRDTWDVEIVSEGKAEGAAIDTPTIPQAVRDARIEAMRDFLNAPDAEKFEHDRAGLLGRLFDLAHGIE